MPGSAAVYSKHLYGQDLDGYLQLAHIDAQTSDLTGSMYVTARQLDALYEMEGNMDYYITANSFYIPHRATSNIRHFRSLYVDLDVDRRSKYSKTEAFYMLYYLADGGEIPTPSMVVDSGRGLHVYWRIEHAPMGAVLTWQAMQDYLYKQLKHLGADPQSTDSARLLRLPGTINSKNGATCQILIINDYIYSLSDLREQYLKYKPKTKKAKTKKSGEVSYIYKPYTLHMARLQDLMTLCKLRNYNVTGCRNTILHLYAYWIGVTVRDETVLRDEVIALNEKFTQPLKDNEIQAVLECIPKVVQDFLEPTTNSRNGYNYRNERLIDILHITKHEQQYMRTIIDRQEKYRRNNERRKKKRRNDAGLTTEQQRTLDIRQKAMSFKAQGLTQKEIADRLGVTQGYISRLLRQG